MKFYSKKTFQLDKSIINQILNLKDSYWKFGIKSQRQFFLNNIKKEDIHNLLFINRRLVGYTLLKNMKIKQSDKLINYLHFDTFIIDKKYRSMNYSPKLMQFNNSIIKKKKSFSILLCENNMLKYYSKFNWLKINKKLIISIKKKKNYMIYNKQLKFKFSFISNS
jgi:hypothetical protein